MRIEREKAFYHVMTRGNQGDHVFEDDPDKLYFLDNLGKAARKYNAIFYGYCLMSNHYHLLVETREPNLSSLMHYVNSTVASRLRKKREVGHIFSGRYKSVIAEKGEHLPALSRYVHLNPVRASLVRLPEEYHWSSYRYFIQEGPVPDWLDTSWMVNFFGGTTEAARTRYRTFVEDGSLDEFSFENDLLKEVAILGGEKFASEVVGSVSSGKRHLRGDVGKNLQAWSLRLEDLHAATCSFYSLERLDRTDAGLNGTRRRARNMFIWLAREYTAAHNSEIGAYIGTLSNSGISRQYQRTRDALRAEDGNAEAWRSEAEAVLSIVRA